MSRFRIRIAQDSNAFELTLTDKGTGEADGVATRECVG